MGFKVIIQLDGLQAVLGNLERLEVTAPANLEKQTAALAQGGEDAWGAATPVRSGKLKGGNQEEVAGLSITYRNATRYYKWVDEGHMTPAGWHTKHGYRPAKRRSHVGGKFMTEALVEFLEGNIEEYLSKFLD